MKKPEPQAKFTTPKEYADLIERLGLSQNGAARFLRIGPRTSRRWIAGEARIPYHVGLLLDLMLQHKIEPDIR
jgi:hypothetical protein